MPVRCRRASSGAQRCKPMKPKCTEEAEICESAMAPVSMPSGMVQTAGGRGEGRWQSGGHPSTWAPDNQKISVASAETQGRDQERTLRVQEVHGKEEVGRERQGELGPRAARRFQARPAPVPSLGQAARDQTGGRDFQWDPLFFSVPSRPGRPTCPAPPLVSPEQLWEKGHPSWQ